MGPSRLGPLLNRPLGDKCSQQRSPSQANAGPKNQGRSSPHSITSSARASSVGGTSRPSALAVLWLIISSYFTLIDPTQKTTSLLDYRVVKPRISRNAI